MGLMKSIYTCRSTGTMPHRGHHDWFAVNQVVRTFETERAGLKPTASKPRQRGEHADPSPWEDVPGQAVDPTG